MKNHLKRGKQAPWTAETPPNSSNTLPNTLIHIALQTPATRAIVPKVEIPWILAGVLIPDLPWIVQRLSHLIGYSDPYPVRLYCTIQASLFFCLLLAAALSLFSRRPLMIFGVLAVNALLHLLLDGLQIKWGNGVHLLAPFSWQPVHYGLIWPEHAIGYLLTAFGVIYLLSRSRTIYRENISLKKPPLGPAALALALYFFLPLLFMGNLERSNANYVEVVKNKETRSGRQIELDRSYYSAESSTVTLFTGEKVQVSGELPEKSGTVSLKGTFTSGRALVSSSFHSHNDYRNHASKVGILLTLIIWVSLLVRNVPKPLRKRNRK